ncbi:MAG TPA: DNA polymerase I [Gammaproteobacteria bacterium]
MTAKPLVLVDGSSYLYRAFHALPPLTTAQGRPTGAVYGVLNMLLKLLDDYDEPEQVAVVFDAPGRTFRDDLYADYKANRAPMPDDLAVQIEPLREAIDAMGIPVLSVEGVEADDVIGTLARQAADAGRTCVISTIDKDMAQLVDERIVLVNTMDGITLDAEGVRAKFGVTPKQITDYLALVGDTSDNIPGVPKVGQKTAAKWLGQYGDLETLKRHADEIPGKVGENLRAHLHELDLNRELATIRCDLELPFGLEAVARRPPERERLTALLTELEFGRLLRRLEERLGAPSGREAAAEAPPAVERRYVTVLTAADLDAWLARLESAEVAAFDLATSGDGYMRAELVGIAVAVAPGEAAYIPVGHRYPGAPEQLPRERVLERLRGWLEGGATKVSHRAKYDGHVLRGCGIRLSGVVHDTGLESYVLDSTATRHDVELTAAKYLNVPLQKLEDVAGKGARQLPLDEVDVAVASGFAAGRADCALRLHAVLGERLRQTGDLARVYEEIERPLVPVLRRMEEAGVRIDADMLRRQSQELAEAMVATERAAYAEAGGPFMLSSPKQLQEVLYERLHLPILGKTPKGQPSTAEDVLEQLAAAGFALPRLVLEYRALAKLKSTYTDRLPREVDPRTGRVHTTYHQAVAATGRLSSSDPNLQNIPIRTPQGRRIRQAFVAPPGYRLVAADYSQIELRIMAHLSRDEGLLAAFAAQEDIHRATAAEVFGTARDAVTADQRRKAKAINFGLIYGMSAFGLAKQLGIDRHEAQRYVDRYFERYPGVKRYMDETRQQARTDGYVSTVFGRRLYLPEINSRNPQRRQYAERSAINAPMQGSAADIIKRAMIAVDAHLAEAGLDARLIMQVHDELVLEVAEPIAERVADAVRRIMEGAADLAVPLKVDTGVGANWDEAH